MRIKRQEKEVAIKLRKEGGSVNGIAKHLQVSASSVSLWVRGIPQPEKLTKEYRAKSKEQRLLRIKELRAQHKIVRRKKILSGAGYWMIYAPLGYKGKVYSTGLIYEHRYVLEQKLGRLLGRHEIAHHINENRLDNRPENLSLSSVFRHNSFHGKERGIAMVVAKCPSCRIVFKIAKRKTCLVRKKYKSTCCSPKCRGRFNRTIQLGKLSKEEIEKRIRENIISEYQEKPENSKV